MVARVIIAGFLTTAALTDLVRRRIYRLWSALALSTGLALVLLAGQWSHLLFALLLFASTYVLWHTGGIGGGDVWLATYLGLALGSDAPLAMLVGSIVGAVVAIALMTTKKLTLKDPLPLGLFWALGGLLVLATGWTIWPA
jgi:Flp pilus assembly protein protease CpaA